MKQLRVSVNRCYNHPGVFALTLDDEDGGTRLLGDGCCGRWIEKHSWPVTPEMIREIVITLECEADEAERQEGGAT